MRSSRSIIAFAATIPVVGVLGAFLLTGRDVPPPTLVNTTAGQETMASSVPASAADAAPITSPVPAPVASAIPTPVTSPIPAGPVGALVGPAVSSCPPGQTAAPPTSITRGGRTFTLPMGCAGPDGKNDIPALVAPAGGPCTAWFDSREAYAELVRLDKQEAFKANPGKVGDHERAHVYVSSPIDITGPGTYELDFGPLAADHFLDWPPQPNATEPPTSYSIVYPPDYRERFSTDATPSVVVKDGARYLRQTIRFDGDPRSCRQLVAWLT